MTPGAPLRSRWPEGAPASHPYRVQEVSSSSSRYAHFRSELSGSQHTNPCLPAGLHLLNQQFLATATEEARPCVPTTQGSLLPRSSQLRQDLSLPSQAALLPHTSSRGKPTEEADELGAVPPSESLRWANWPENRFPHVFISPETTPHHHSRHSTESPGAFAENITETMTPDPPC